MSRCKLRCLTVMCALLLRVGALAAAEGEGARSLAVVETNPELAPLSLLVQAQLTQKGLVLVERGELDRILQEQGLSAAGLASPDALVKVGALLRADGFLLLSLEETGPAGGTVVTAMPFTDSSEQGEYAPLAEAMGELLASTLDHVDGIVFVERSALDRVLAEQKLALAGLEDERTRAQVGRLLGADYVLTGGVAVLDRKVKVNAHLFDVKTTQLVRSESAQGALDDCMAVVTELAQKLAKDLNRVLPEVKPEDVDKSPEANLHYMRGLGYYYAGMYDQAAMELLNALSLSPSHADARLWCARNFLAQREYLHAAVEAGAFLKDWPDHRSAAEARRILSASEEKLEPWEKDELQALQARGGSR